jgi:polyphosphate kinase 2 (PPK2 family)
VGRLDQVDLSQKLGSSEYEERLSAAQTRLVARRLQLGGMIGDGRFGPPVCVLFEGWDASGKGGAIQRLTAEIDHRHVRVASFSAPTPDEKRHHYLWRFYPKLPGWGGVAVFDRSWYGRVLVERVEELASEEEWRRSYSEIRELERSLTNNGMILIKFWMHISAEEQLKRFERRQGTPLKRWKLTPEDWRNRERRDDYCQAIEDMFEHTDRDNAPWMIVPGDSKKFARVFVIEHVVDRIESGMREHGFEPLTDEELQAA